MNLTIFDYKDGALPRIQHDARGQNEGKPNELEKKFYLESVKIFLVERDLSLDQFLSSWYSLSPREVQTSDEEYLAHIFEDFIYKSVKITHTQAAIYFAQCIESFPIMQLINDMSSGSIPIREVVEFGLLSSNLYIYPSLEVNASIHVKKQIPIPSIYISHGMLDAMGSNAHLCTFYSTIKVGEVLLPLTRHLNHNLFKKCLDAFTELVECFEGKRVGINLEEDFPLKPGQEYLAAILSRGATYLILFHEYTHFVLNGLLGAKLSKKEEEEICDIIATNILMSTLNDKLALGGYLALYFIHIFDISKDAFTKEQNLNKYPTISERMSRYIDELEKLLIHLYGPNNKHNYNYFDFIPAKWVEIEFFNKETSVLIDKSLNECFYEYLLTSGLEIDVINDLSTEISKYCFSLALLGEYFNSRTFSKAENGIIRQNVIFNYYQFRYILRNVCFSYKVDIDQNILREIVLSLIRTLEGVEIKNYALKAFLFDQIIIIDQIIDKTKLLDNLIQSDFENESFESGLLWLSERGFITEENNNIKPGNISFIKLSILIR